MSQKISAMTAATDLKSATVPIVQGGANKKASDTLILPPTYPTGNYIMPLQPIGFNLTTAAPTINRLQMHVFFVAYNMTIDLLAFEVTAGATGKAWCAIYDANFVLKCWSTEKTITAPGVYTGINASVTLTPGIYFFAWLVDTANTFRYCTSNQYCQINLGFTSALGGTFYNAYFKALAYQNTPPDPVSGLTFSAGTAAMALFFRTA